MSDPVTNVEIEDVVSSIRRLFSEDKRQTADSDEITEKQGDSATTQPAEAGERLVLTSAFRVDQSNPHASGEAIDPIVESDAASADLVSDSVDNSQGSDRRRLHLHSDPADSLKKPEELDVLVLSDAQVATDNGASFERAVHAPINQRASDEAIIASQDRQNSLETTIAELEAAISDQGNYFEPDGSEEIGSIPENEPLQWQDPEGDAPLVFNPAPETSVNEVIELDNSAPQDVDPAFVRRHAAPSDADLEEELEPSFSDAEPEDLQAALDKEALSEDDLSLDEDALRDLVSEIVRQELQGALGERITRNVRKLVRREIHRIISSQEFD